MKAELFINARTADLEPVIRRLVAAEVDARIPVEVSTVGAGGEQNVVVANRYAQLLQAAIPPELGLTLSVTSLSWLGERTYLQVYWPVAYPSYHGATRSFSPGELDAFFPALAIRDRMVLVPVGQGELLGAVHGVAQTTSVLRGDVAEIDFRDEAAVGAALRTVAGSLTEQLQHELAAWAAGAPEQPIDLAGAARDLDVDAGLLNRILTDRIEQIRVPYRALSCELNTTRLPHGRWTRVMLTATNGSDVPMPRVLLSIAGPVEVRPDRVEVALPAGGAVEVPIAVKPTDLGEFPIEITLVQPQDVPFSTWLLPVHVWMESTDQSNP
ncbi:MAG: hypothetical protein L0Y54_15400 [Sporichthyaceae bacterium]|nr:hypothetical protein [Sporichthyaceae bacterium]